MSLTLNMVGGGGGGLKNTNAIVIVTAQTGSTITMTKGAVSLTPTIWTKSTDNSLDNAIFSIKPSSFDANAWTVTATLNGNTLTDTVVVNTAKEYDVDLISILYLYKAGDTSGWTNYPWACASGMGARAATITYGDNDMTISQTGNHSSVTYHTQLVDLTRYSTVVFELSAWPAANNDYNGIYIFANLNGTYYGNSYAAKKARTGAGTQSLPVDVSSLSGNYYVAIATEKISSTDSIPVITSVYASV